MLLSIICLSLPSLAIFLFFEWEDVLQEIEDLPKLPGHTCVRRFIIVVGRDIIISPTRAIVSRVGASLEDTRSSEFGSSQGE